MMPPFSTRIAMRFACGVSTELLKDAVSSALFLSEASVDTTLFVTASAEDGESSTDAQVLLSEHSAAAVFVEMELTYNAGEAKFDEALLLQALASETDLPETSITLGEENNTRAGDVDVVSISASLAPEPGTTAKLHASLTEDATIASIGQKAGASSIQLVSNGVEYNADEVYDALMPRLSDLEARVGCAVVWIVSEAVHASPAPPAPPPSPSPPPCLTGDEVMILARFARKGATEIELEALRCGMSVGAKLLLGDGQKAEIVQVTGFATTTLTTRLLYFHDEGTAVQLLWSQPQPPEPPPPSLPPFSPLPDGVKIVTVTMVLASFKVTLAADLSDINLDDAEVQLKEQVCAGVPGCSVTLSSVVSGSTVLAAEATEPAVDSDGNESNLPDRVGQFASEPPEELGGSAVEGVTEPKISKYTETLVVAPPPPPPSTPPPSLPPARPQSQLRKTRRGLAPMTAVRRHGAG